MQIKHLRVALSCPLFILLVSVAAAVIFFGTVVAYINIVKEIDFGTLKIGEVQTRVLAVANDTIEPYSLNLSIVCLGKDAISSRLEFKSDGVLKSKVLDLNDTNPIDTKIDAGNIRRTVVGARQGRFNCSITPQLSNYTIMNMVDSI